QREKLEALMDTDKRDKIFPTEVGMEPSVVVAMGGDTDEWEKIEWEAKEKVLAEEKAAAEAKQKATAEQATKAAGEKERVRAEQDKQERTRRETAEQLAASSPPTEAADLVRELVAEAKRPDDIDTVPMPKIADPEPSVLVAKVEPPAPEPVVPEPPAPEPSVIVAPEPPAPEPS